MDKIDKMMSRMLDYAIERPEKAPSRVLVINFSKSSIEKVLTPSRVEILKVVLRDKPKTVGMLTGLLKRPKESVSRDLRILSNYGLLSFIHAGRQKTPKVEKDVITMPLTV
ncbi:MAG: ArsR family transcriptional regulator [Candidatus Marsarchaeota archaeon]|jgi:predicted transcriptional regulator|nr:ArsR family transcriptional regulator [Candidatus Marsarchaeota archaeon]MCL5111266.1 ArsR family transcriptional regulator [Candidatus Marsarchaeota archaeon]